MVDREVFDRRLGRLERLLVDLRSHAGLSRAAFLADRGIQAQVERWMHLAVECALDLAHHLISDRGWSTPQTYRETFRILAEQGVLDPALAKAMEGWAGLRNILVHMYLDIDHARLWSVLTGELDQLERYAAALVKALPSLQGPSS